MGKGPMTWRCPVCGILEVSPPSDGIPSCGRCPSSRATEQHILACTDSDGAPIPNAPYTLELCRECSSPVLRKRSNRLLAEGFLVCFQCRQSKTVKCEHPLHVPWKHGSVNVFAESAAHCLYTYRTKSGRDTPGSGVICPRCASRCGAIPYVEAVALGETATLGMELSLERTPWEEYDGRVLWSRRADVTGERHVVRPMRFVRGLNRGHDVWYLECEHMVGGAIAPKTVITLHPSVLSAFRREVEARRSGAKRWHSTRGARYRASAVNVDALGWCHVVMLRSSSSPSTGEPGSSYAYIEAESLHAGESIVQWAHRKISRPLVAHDDGSVSL